MLKTHYLELTNYFFRNILISCVDFVHMGFDFILNSKLTNRTLWDSDEKAMKHYTELSSHSKVLKLNSIEKK